MKCHKCFKRPVTTLNSIGYFGGYIWWGLLKEKNQIVGRIQEGWEIKKVKKWIDEKQGQEREIKKAKKNGNDVTKWGREREGGEEKMLYEKKWMLRNENIENETSKETSGKEIGVEEEKEAAT